MKTINKPELVSLKTGASFKVLKVTGQAGMHMPLHYSTKEAVLIVQGGSALLNIDEKEHLLQAGDSFIIPARQNHNLSLKSEFKALVIMSLDSNIEFVK
ncbi:MAG TPA: cupin domain-containing protein [Ignavibacteria bacterium]|jgi:quercetin dioxygenase-like cupin family protein